MSALAISALLAGGGLAAPESSPSLRDTVEAIQKSRVSTRILFITAHPDDESSGLLAYLSHGLGAEVALFQVTRGQGGQNAIGPEQDGQLGVIRTTELLAADHEYGVEQFFSRAIDNGFSKSPDQMIRFWGDLPVEDMVRVIRTYRPQVVINGWGGVHSGHGQHQATGILTPKAVMEAADSNAFPQQIAEGLSPWKVTLELRLASNFDPAANKAVPLPAGAMQMPVQDVSPLWGQSYVEMGMNGRSAHRSQGTPALFSSNFFRRPVFMLAENDKGPAGAFDTRLLNEPLSALAERFPHLQSELQPALGSADQSLASAEKSALNLDRATAAKSLAEAGKEIARLESKLSGAGDAEAVAARWEIARERAKIDAALQNDIAVPIGSQADRHELVAGEEVLVDVILAGKPAVPVKWTLDKSSIVVPTGWSAAPEPMKENNGTSRFAVAIPAGAKQTLTPADGVLPFPPALVRLELPVNVEGYDFKIQKPIESSVAKTTGIETYPLELVPAVTLTVDPAEVIVPEKHASSPIILFARVRYHAARPGKVSVGIDTPPGWSVQPNQPLDFSAPGDQLIRFVISPPPHLAPGGYSLHPFAKLGEETFRTSMEPIPTLPTRDWAEPADATAHVLDLNVPPNLHVGYIAGDNDVVPEALRQIGIQVDTLDEAAVAFNDLSHYDAIIVGIRAYELRPDLPRMNWRLLDYAKSGGSLVVEYQRDFAWNKLLPAPFPAKMADQGVRVTDPNSPVRFLAPENSLLNSPNKITPADFEGWIQERGIYFWSTFSAPYQAILGLKDGNEPEANGGLVYARDGRGAYIYTGLSFFRELPAGVPGAYRLFVNLISQTRRSRGS